MLVVTGGAGFIGSALVHALCDDGREVVVVDDLRDSSKHANLVGAPVADLVDAEDFPALLAGGRRFGAVEAVLHQGAISSTTHPDGRELMARNYEYSRSLLGVCLERSIPLVYASSAAVYGRTGSFSEDPANESPLNLYGRSKELFDRVVRRALPDARSQIVGLRYFNVYGPREDHKGTMASMIHRLDAELTRDGVASIFGASHGCGPGEQRRDFVHVDDVVAVVTWFVEHPEVSGIFNCGTGRSRSFNDVVAELVRWHPGGEVKYLTIPDAIERAYQPHTEADLTRLRAAGYGAEFLDLAEGVRRFVEARAGDER